MVPKCKNRPKSGFSKGGKSIGSQDYKNYCENFNYDHGDPDDHDHHIHDYMHGPGKRKYHLLGDYYKLDYLNTVALESTYRYKLNNTALVWESSLRPPISRS